MPNLKINLCTAALVALLSTTLTASFDPGTDVQEASNKDFSDDGQLVLKKIAVRVRYGQSEYGQARDLTRTTLSATHFYHIVCRSESLRSSSETRSRSQDLVEAALEQLAGARLLLPDGTRSEPLLIRSVQGVNDQFGPVEDCYGITVEVSGFVQYSGANASPTGETA